MSNSRGNFYLPGFPDYQLCFQWHDLEQNVM